MNDSSEAPEQGLRTNFIFTIPPSHAANCGGEHDSRFNGIVCQNKCTACSSPSLSVPSVGLEREVGYNAPSLSASLWDILENYLFVTGGIGNNFVPEKLLTAVFGYFSNWLSNVDSWLKINGAL